jgi:cytochrome P450
MSEIKVLTDLDIWGEPKRFDPTRPNPDEDETDCQEVEGEPDNETEAQSHLDAAIGGRYR